MLYTVYVRPLRTPGRSMVLRCGETNAVRIDGLWQKDVFEIHVTATAYNYPLESEPSETLKGELKE